MMQAMNWLASVEESALDGEPVTTTPPCASYMACRSIRGSRGAYVSTTHGSRRTVCSSRQ